MPHMRSRLSGLIIQVSSRVGRVIIFGVSLYASRNFALETPTEAAHYESTPQGIDFAIIQPTAYDTDVNRNPRKNYREITWPLIEHERPRGAAFHSAFLEKLDRDFSGQPNANPQEVTDLALAISETTRQRRVLRYPIGWEGELAAVRRMNDFIADIQSTALRDSGYGHLYQRRNPARLLKKAHMWFSACPGGPRDLSYAKIG